MLSEAFKRLRKPIIEGEKIKVYRFSNLVTENRFRDFALLESWGWEDVFSDMLNDHTVKRLIDDVKKLMHDGWSADMVEDQLEHLVDKASTRLTSEEKTVLLKWIEKNEENLKGPERGLAAFNRRSQRQWAVRESVEQISESRYAFSDFECEEYGTAFAEKDAFAGPIDEPKKPIEDHYELFCPKCGSNNINRSK